MLRLLVVLLTLVVVPGAWAYTEYRAAVEQTRFVAATGGQWAQERLGALFGRFETVTLRLRPGATPAENAALTARLLRLEPQLSPATTLFVVNPQLRIVAASHPVDGDVLGQEAGGWLRAMLDGRSDRIELGIFGNPPLLGLPGHVAMARRLDDGTGSAGIALSFIEQGELRALIHPAWLRRAGAVRLVDDASGRVIAAHEPNGSGEEEPHRSGLVAAMQKGAEAVRGVERVLVQVSVGQGVSWSVALDPWAVLGRDEAGLRQRGLAALSLAVVLATLTLLASLIPAGRAPRRHGGATGVVARPRDERPSAAEPLPAPVSAPAPAPGIDQNHPTAPVNFALPVAGERDVTRQQVQAPPLHADPASLVEGILDSDYVDAAVFEALVQEFGKDRAAGMLREFLAAADLRFPRLAKLAAAREWRAFVPAFEELGAVATTFGAVRFSGSLQRFSETTDDTAPELDFGAISNEWRQTKRALLNLVAPDKDRGGSLRNAG